MSRILAVFCMVTLMRPLGAQTQAIRLTGPVLGFFYSDNLHTIQPIIGSPGSAHFGSPLLTGVSAASISPAGDWALVRLGSRLVLTGGLRTGAATGSSSDSLLPEIDRIAWAADGSAALLYSADTNRLQTVHFSGLDVLADAPVDVPSSGPITALAITPGGLQAIVSIASPDGGQVYAWNGKENPVLLLSVGQSGILVVSDDGTRVYAIDAAAGNIVESPSAIGAMQTVAPLSNPNGVTLDPVGLAVSPDNRYLFVADRATRAIVIYDTASGTFVTSIPLDFAPSRLERVSVDGVFALNAAGRDEWLLLLDARETPRVEFVPANGGLQ